MLPCQLPSMAIHSNVLDAHFHEEQKKLVCDPFPVCPYYAMHQCNSTDIFNYLTFECYYNTYHSSKKLIIHITAVLNIMTLYVYPSLPSRPIIGG